MKKTKLLCNRHRGSAFLMALLFLVASWDAFANDGVYYVCGNQLVPLAETDISISKEVLSISLMDNGYARVDVYYEFLNPSSGVRRLLMGFEADPPYNDDYRFYPSGVHPNIKDFTVEMNGKNLSYRNAVCMVDTLPLMRVDTSKSYYVWDNNWLYEQGKGPEEDGGTWEEGVRFAYVYYFEAQFLPGINRIHHTYTCRLSKLVGVSYVFNYKLSPASRWAGGKIGDFTLVIRADNTAKYFHVPCDVFPGSDFEVVEGTGKTRIREDRDVMFKEQEVAIAIRNGAVRLHVVDFEPRVELNITSSGVFDMEYKFGMAYDRMSSIDLWGFEQCVAKNPGDSAFFRRVAHNLPYAHRGHVFRNEALRKYFESLWWYMPDPSYKDSTADFTEVDWMYIKF